MSIALKSGTLTKELRKKRQLSEALRMLKQDAEVGKKTPVNWLINPGNTHASRYIYGLLFSFTSIEKSADDEPITPEIRMMLLDALIKEADDPKKLGKWVSINQAMHYGRAEMFLTLVETLGIEFKDYHFVRAAFPMNAPGTSIKMLSALRPYVKDVNVVDSSGRNAGHVAAYVGDLNAFKRLEVDGIRQQMKDWTSGTQGLNKTAMAKTNTPTYTHMAALCKDQKKAGVFIKHLAENGYELDVRAKKLENYPGTPHTPIESAADQGLFDNALTLADLGAKITPEVLAVAIQQTVVHNRNIQDIVDFMDGLAERKLLDEEILVAAAEKLNIWDNPRKEKLADICTIGKAITDHAVRLGYADQIPAVPNTDYIDAPEFYL